MAALPDEPSARDAQRLRAQAATLTTRADRMREDYLALRSQASTLARLADEIDQAVARRPARRRLPAAARDMALVDRVCATLEGTGPLSSGDIAQHLHVSTTRVRAALSRLESAGLVLRTGLKRGTRYELVAEAEPASEPGNVRVFGNYAALVRDVARRLGTFTVIDLQAELPQLSEATLRRWLREWEKRGVVTSERLGHGKVYGYEPPAPARAERVKQAPPEIVVTKIEAIASRRPAEVTSGRRFRSSVKAVNELIREAGTHGVTVTKVSSGHLVWTTTDGQTMTTASTPRNGTAHAMRDELRKLGVPV